MATRIQLRRDTAANWTSVNPTLAQGEEGYETDTGKRKVGDGTTAWTSLAYSGASAADASTTVKGVSKLSVAPTSPTDPIAVGDNDTRMSNARTPTAHATSHQPGGSDAMAVDAAAATGSLRTLGTGATQALPGNHSSTTDARTPTAHKTSHEPGGSDALTALTDASIAAANKDGAAGTASMRTLGSGATQAAAGNDSRLSDARTPTAHTHNASDVNAGTLAVARLGSGTPAAGKYVDGGTGAWTALPAGGGYTPSWVQTGATKLYSSIGDGDPMNAHQDMNTMVPGPTNAQYNSVTTARCVKFRLPVNLDLSAVRWFQIGVPGTAILSFAIYPMSGAKLWSNAAFIGTANAWNATTGITGVTLSANTDYWWCQFLNSISGAIVYWRTPPAPVHSAFYGAAATPLGGLSIGMWEFAQFTITAGTWPANTPAIAAAAYGGATTGSLPVGILEGTAS